MAFYGQQASHARRPLLHYRARRFERALCLNAKSAGNDNGHSRWPLVFLLRHARLSLITANCNPLSLRRATTFFFTTMDINKQLAALTTSELQTAGASQATAIAVSVLLRHLQSPDLSKLLSSAFENHQAVMLQTPWPDQMLQSFEATRRFLEGAARPPAADETPRSPD